MAGLLIVIGLIVALILGLNTYFVKPQAWYEGLVRCECAEFERKDGLYVNNGEVFELETAGELGAFFFLVAGYLGLLWARNLVGPIDGNCLQRSSFGFRLVYLILLTVFSVPLWAPTWYGEHWPFWYRVAFY